MGQVLVLQTSTCSVKKISSISRFMLELSWRKLSTLNLFKICSYCLNFAFIQIILYEMIWSIINIILNYWFWLKLDSIWTIIKQNIWLIFIKKKNTQKFLNIIHVHRSRFELKNDEQYYWRIKWVKLSILIQIWLI